MFKFIILYNTVNFLNIKFKLKTWILLIRARRALEWKNDPLRTQFVTKVFECVVFYTDANVNGTSMKYVVYLIITAVVTSKNECMGYVYIGLGF